MRISTSLFSLAVAGLMATSALAADPAAPAAPPVAAPSAEPDRMQQTICRKDKVIGSLIATRKTCHTRAQWAYIDDTNQAFSRDLADNTRSRSNGN